ncbi:MAG: UbiD family decarboxylase [Deltaproteobacteria bacterium]|nr:UbiD family decarboxylase [Deltaproteobacteria bacterium]
MASPDLRSFLDQQETAGRVWRIADELEPDYQVARRIHDAGARLLLFERVRGYGSAVIANLAASRELCAAAVGVAPAKLVAHLAAAAATAGRIEVRSEAPFMANREQRPDVIRTVPLMRFFPRGERIYATAGVICVRHPQHGVNLSYHRMMYLGGNRFAVRVCPRHLHQILELGGGRAEIAAALGLHPAIGIAAATSGGPDFDELRFAASLLGGSLDCVDLDGVLVPAGAELVWRGRFTGELADEGPFVDLTGTYDSVRRQPVLEVTEQLWRDNFLYQVILPGGSEHRVLMGVPQEPRIYRAVQNAVAGLRAVALTPGGCGWLHAVIAIEQRAPGQGKNAGLAALAAHPSLKRVVVVDTDIDVDDPTAVEWAIATRVQPDRDLVVVTGAHGSSLDPSRDPVAETTAKWVIDATRPFGARDEEYARVAPPT